MCRRRSGPMVRDAALGRRARLLTMRRVWRAWWRAIWDKSRDNGSAFFFCLPSRAKSAMAEILVSDLCKCRPPLLIGGRFHCGRDERARRALEAGSDCTPRVRSFCGLFFHCLPLFPRRRLFPCLCKGLHCNWRAFSIVDRLYFSGKFFPSARPFPVKCARRATVEREILPKLVPCRFPVNRLYLQARQNLT